MTTIHHLHKSRSERLLFLAHELSLPHAVVPYHRDPKLMVAPPELAAKHPMGTAPLLEDGQIVIAESGAALIYLNRTHGDGRLEPKPGTAEHERCLELIHFNEGTLMPLLTTTMYLKVSGVAVGEGWAGAIVQERLGRAVSWLDSLLRDQPYLCGDGLSLADIMTAFTLDFMMDVTFPGLFGPLPCCETADALRVYAARIRQLPGYLYSTGQF